MVSPHRQRGAALLIFVLALVGIFLSTFAMIRASAGLENRHTLAKAQKTWIDGAASAVKAFYLSNAAAMDANSAAPWTGLAILEDAGISQKWRVQVFVGARQSNSATGLMWRSIWIVLPPNGQASTASYDSTTNTFSAGNATIWRRVSGQSVEMSLYREASDQLDNLGALLVGMFRAHVELDPSHNQGVNYFQASGCSANSSPLIAGSGGIACTNGSYLPLNQLGLSDAVTEGGISYVNPWGIAILGSNTVGQNTSAPPYTMQLNSPYPWGGYVSKIVTEPM